ncbi:MAG: hypothetical protein GTN72_08495 [Candidatus Latescibacteria bacterium]|nr:hypothetical protein [Candidatus Latescibacterota bacterium]
MMYIRSVFILVLVILISACGDDPVSVSAKKYSELIESSFKVNEQSTLTIENFVGGIIIRSGDPDTIQVSATKWAPRQQDLGFIEIEMTAQQNGVRIVTRKPSSLQNASVDFEIFAPPDARMDLYSGVGSFDYLGRPGGNNFFQLGVGSIMFQLPAGVNIQVELETGVGSIAVEFPVDGLVSDQMVSGTIGSGDEGEVHVSTGVGSIYLARLQYSNPFLQSSFKNILAADRCVI